MTTTTTTDYSFNKDDDEVSVSSSPPILVFHCDRGDSLSLRLLFGLRSFL